MSRMIYNKVTSQRRHPLRGFWLRRRRFSICRLGVRFFSFIKFLCKWKFLYRQGLKLLKKDITKRGITSSKGNKDNLKMRMVSSYGSHHQASSFYSDAISDCLEFIKMSAVSSHENSIGH